VLRPEANDTKAQNPRPGIFGSDPEVVIQMELLPIYPVQIKNCVNSTPSSGSVKILGFAAVNTYAKSAG